MKVTGLLAISLLGAALASAFQVAAQADMTPSCQAKPIAAARTAAQARRDAGDPAGAFKILGPFVDLGCLGDVKATAGPKRQMSSDYAWLLNDAYVNGADKRFGHGAPEGDACMALLGPLTNDSLVPHKWMSPALRQATAANIAACAKDCYPSPDCQDFRANVYASITSLMKTFRKQPCQDGAGQVLDDGRCIELRGKAGVGFIWHEHIKTDLPTEADERAYCPALYLRTAASKQAVRLELPEASALRSGTFCCETFHLRVKPGTNEFMILSDNVAFECNGGTARTLIEEIYRLPPAAAAPTLVRDNSMGLH